MSNYMTIKNMDVANGEGIGVSLFFAGCEFHCPQCFNSEAWDFEDGQPITEATIKELMEMLGDEHIDHLSILGGEPLHPRNIISTAYIVTQAKLLYPTKKIWLWSGYNWEELMERINYTEEELDELTGEEYADYLALDSVLEALDVLTDGRFDVNKKDLTAFFKGSLNQRTIDVQATLYKEDPEDKRVILYHE